MPKRHRGKNAKKGNENSPIPIDRAAKQSEITSEIILEDKVNKAFTEEKPENIKGETLQADVKENEKNQEEILSAEKKNDNVQPNMAEPQHLEPKQEEVEKPGLQTLAEPSVLKQEPQKQSVKKSEQTKSVNKNNKQSKRDQISSEATFELKSTESVKNEQVQNKPENQSEIKQSDQQRKGETKKVDRQSLVAKQKENNKRPETLKPDSSAIEKIISESLEKTKPTETINDQTKSTKSEKPNPNQTETKSNKLSTVKELQTHLSKHNSKKNNDMNEESSTNDSILVKDQVKENKSINKKQDLSKQHTKKIISSKQDTKKTDIDEGQNKLPEIDTNNGKCKNSAKQSAKQSGISSNNKEQSIVKENELGKTQVMQSEVSAPKIKKTEQLEIKAKSGKSKPSDKSTAPSKKSDSSPRENGSGKETVQSKTEPLQSDAQPEIKNAAKPDAKQAILTKSNVKKVEHKKADSKQAPDNYSVKLADSGDATQSESLTGKITETSKSASSGSETNNLASTISEKKKKDSKQAELRKSEVNLTNSTKNAETVELNAGNLSEPMPQEQPKALLLTTDLNQAIDNKQTDLTTAPSGKAELDIKDVMLDKLTSVEDVNAQAKIITQCISLGKEIPQSDDNFIESNEPHSLKTKSIALDALEHSKSNILGEESGKPAELKEVQNHLKNCKVSEVEEIDSTKLEANIYKLQNTDSIEVIGTASGLKETKSSEPFMKETESSKAKNIQQAPTTNEIKIPDSNRVAGKTEPLTYAQVAETPKVENKTKSDEEQTKQSDGEALKEALSCSLPSPVSQKESENYEKNSLSSTPRNLEIGKKKSNENEEAKPELNQEKTIESNVAANASPINLSSVPEDPQVQGIPPTPTECQEESVNVQELTEHVMNILNEGGTDQHDLLKKNVELQQFIVKLIHLLKEKTDLCANLDRQNSALTSQSKSLKDVIAITKDLLGIRNLEVDRLHGDLNLMENAIKEERTRHNTAVQHLTEAMGINDKLKKEYHIQMDLFEKLKEKYTEKVVLLTRENMRMKALLQQHGIDPSVVPDCMLPVNPDQLEPCQAEHLIFCFC